MEEEKNILDLIKDIQDISSNSEGDAEKVLKNNKTAGIRLRRKMNDIKHKALDIRKKVQEIKKENN